MNSGHGDSRDSYNFAADELTAWPFRAQKSHSLSNKCKDNKPPPAFLKFSGVILFF